MEGPSIKTWMLVIGLENLVDMEMFVRIRIILGKSHDHAISDRFDNASIYMDVWSMIRGHFGHSRHDFHGYFLIFMTFSTSFGKRWNILSSGR